MANNYLPSGPKNTERQDEIVKSHRQFQQSLDGSVDVRIPFADLLVEKMPKARIEMRRVIGQVLAVIEAIAFLHQHQRERTADGFLLATIKDYEIARQLLLRPLNRSIGLEDDFEKSEAILNKLKAEFPTGAFSSNEATKKVFNNAKATCHRWLQKLFGLGLLEKAGEAKGNMPARWKFTGKSLDEALLPSAASLGVSEGAKMT